MTLHDAFDICIHWEMITIDLVVSAAIHSYKFFLVRTFKICSISNFQMYNIVLLAVVTMLYLTSL